MSLDASEPFPEMPPDDTPELPPRYTIMLSNVDGSNLPSVRRTRYQSEPEARDAAMRWLRLHRNASKWLPRHYDQWSVLLRGPDGLTRLVKSGRPEA